MRLPQTVLFMIGLVLFLNESADAQVLLSPAHRNQKWGYVDADRKFVIEPQFDLAGPFANGLAPVKRNGLYGYIDAKGAFKIEPRFQLAGVFSEGLASVSVDGRFGYVNTRGEFVINPQFQWAGRFREKRAVFFSGESYGFIDEHGKQVIDAQFAHARDFSQSLAAVSRDGPFGFIDLKGKEVIKPAFRSAGEFHEGLAWMQDADGKFGYIDRQGSTVISPRFSGAGDFLRGVATASSGERSFFINNAGGNISGREFDWVAILPNGRLTAGDGPKVHGGRLTTIGKCSLDFIGAVDPDLADVEFTTNRVPAAIYKPTLYEYDHTNDKTALQIPKYRVARGDTNITDSLSVSQVYMIMFVKDGLMEARRCVPGVDPKVSANFP